MISPAAWSSDLGHWTGLSARLIQHQRTLSMEKGWLWDCEFLLVFASLYFMLALSIFVSFIAPSVFKAGIVGRTRIYHILFFVSQHTNTGLWVLPNFLRNQCTWKIAIEPVSPTSKRRPAFSATFIWNIALNKSSRLLYAIAPVASPDLSVWAPLSPKS